MVAVAMIRECIVCAAPFEAKRSDAQYCGNTCAQRASRAAQPQEPMLPAETGREYQEHGLFPDELRTEEEFTAALIVWAVFLAKAGLLSKIESIVAGWRIENMSNTDDAHDPAEFDTVELSLTEQ